MSSPIEARPVTVKGEIFLTQSVAFQPLDDARVYVLSSDPQTIQPVIVDDRLDLLVDGRVVFSHNFSETGFVQPAVLFLPANVVQQISGRVVTVELRDVYDVRVGASPIYVLNTGP